jgi:hypothetical protein
MPTVSIDTFSDANRLEERGRFPTGQVVAFVTTTKARKTIRKEIACPGRNLPLGVPRHVLGSLLSNRIEFSRIRQATSMGSVPGYRSNASANNDATPRSIPTSSFESLTSEQIEAHMEKFRYGSFDLTDAVRPSFDLQVIPRQGFRHDCYTDPKTGTKIPVIMAAASRDRLFDLFSDLVDCLGGTVDVVLETSHDGDSGEHQDLYREHIDVPVLKSALYEFEEMLLNDGCTGIAILNPAKQQEIQFDEHKMLICYGSPLEIFERILIKHDVYPDEQIRFITEAEHVHSSTDGFARQFYELQSRLCIDVDGYGDESYEC